MINPDKVLILKIFYIFIKLINKNKMVENVAKLHPRNDEGNKYTMGEACCCGINPGCHWFLLIIYKIFKPKFLFFLIS